ncbi:unnamed protein product [Adineta ricciae]|uniref:Uncharacterized protein n=2 Tax=Adineta ricciae TaxID=249248 RepID=A0A813ZPV0_ADIRI|nr:unnamed protein product [Adineta ricciae]
MSSLFKLLLIVLMSSFSISDVFDTGRQKYQQIELLSKSSTETSSCWHRVLTMLHERCSLDQLDQYQSLIAYQFTLCHLSTMNSDLTSIACDEHRVESCVEKLHQYTNAFIAYTEFYPFVQSVCYVLHEKSYQSELTSRLTYFLENSQETITKLVSSIQLQTELTQKIKHQQYIQETILTNAMKLKDLARINMDKTQDILSNVIQAARHEYDLLKQICALSQTIQTIVRITCTYSFWFYALSMFAIYMITIPKRTNRARSMLFSGMFLYVLLERYLQMSTIINFYQWRLICWTCCLLVLIRFAYKYQSRTEIHHEQLHRISTNLMQTEATFHRVSRELKRARSRSRSRSRSIRARQRQTQLPSPLVQDRTNENKENTQPIDKIPPSQSHLIDDENDQSFINHTNKRHYSLLLSREQSRSSKPIQVLLESKKVNSNI